MKQLKKTKVLAGWLLPDWERNQLQAMFPAVYAVDKSIQHHVTLRNGVDPDEFTLPQIYHGTVVGHVDDHRGVQALVVEIGGTTHRPDGGTYHITWSLDRAAGRKPFDSNKVLLLGWQKVAPVEIALEPAFFTIPV